MGKICKSCTNIIRTKEKSERIAREEEKRGETRKIKSDYYKQRKLEQKKVAKKKRPFSIRYSDTMGVEWLFEPDYEEQQARRVNFCVKCRKNRLHYAGWWVRAGGPYGSSDTNKRIFICSECWKPKDKDKD